MIWLYLQKAMYRPCDLDLWPMKVKMFLCIEYHPINILHRFQIDISSNSWEIKYQNIGRTHTQTDRQTHTQTDRQTDRVKTIPRNPLRGRGNKNTPPPPPNSRITQNTSVFSPSYKFTRFMHYKYVLRLYRYLPVLWFYDRQYPEGWIKEMFSSH